MRYVKRGSKLDYFLGTINHDLRAFLIIELDGKKSWMEGLSLNELFLDLYQCSGSEENTFCRAAISSQIRELVRAGILQQGRRKKIATKANIDRTVTTWALTEKGQRYQSATAVMINAFGQAGLTLEEVYGINRTPYQSQITFELMLNLHARKMTYSSLEREVCGEYGTADNTFWRHVQQLSGCDVIHYDPFTNTQYGHVWSGGVTITKTDYREITGKYLELESFFMGAQSLFSLGQVFTTEELADNLGISIKQAQTVARQLDEVGLSTKKSARNYTLIQLTPEGILLARAMEKVWSHLSKGENLEWSLDNGAVNNWLCRYASIKRG